MSISPIVMHVCSSIYYRNQYRGRHKLSIYFLRLKSSRIDEDYFLYLCKLSYVTELWRIYGPGTSRPLFPSNMVSEIEDNETGSGVSIVDINNSYIFHERY